jgi:hypothetical protein
LSRIELAAYSPALRKAGYALANHVAARNQLGVVGQRRERSRVRMRDAACANNSKADPIYHCPDGFY